MNEQYPCVEIESEITQLMKDMTYTQLVSLLEFGKRIAKKDKE